MDFSPRHADLPKVSVITVTFHDLAGLKKTRDSITSQRYEGRIQHIIVDGGSGSSTVDYLSKLDSMCDWVSESDSGIYDAMNKGIRMASGDVLWFMNSSDVFSNRDSISLAMRALSDPIAQWGYGKIQWLNPDGTVQSTHGKPYYSSWRHRLGIDMVPHQGAFFGRKIVESVGGYSLSQPVAADQEFIIECSRVAEPVILDEILALFDTNGISGHLTRREHYMNMRSVRESLGYSVTGSKYLDRLLDRLLIPAEWINAILKRI